MAQTQSRTRQRHNGSGDADRRGGGSKRQRGGQKSSPLSGLREFAGRNPSTQNLWDEAERYLSNGASGVVRSLTDKVSEATQSLEEGSGLGEVAKGMLGGGNPVGAVAKGIGTAVKNKFSGGGKGGGGQGGVKAVHMSEQVDVGVPVQTAYDQWTQFKEFAQFTKGVQSVEQTGDEEVVWHAKIWWSSRSWTARISEQVPNERISWESDGEKGSPNGVVTFHELAPNLTRVLVTVEYHPKGFMEKTANIWRAQGRRLRLDLQHFRRFVMFQGEATGGWHGEIRDGEVVRGHDEGGQRGRRSRGGDQGSRGGGQGSRGGGQGSRGGAPRSSGAGQRSRGGGQNGEGASRGRSSSRRGSGSESESRSRSSSGRSGSPRSSSRRRSNGDREPASSGSRRGQS
jgi:uncharacterized membrane protein